ncbi:conserved Plasmodium protein, unknown function [Plasmodium sp. gorilla clade G1]|nr:conserved Plasmodium protein, unknown function [Plasmodium sp. gorilla clade G1]
MNIHFINIIFLFFFFGVHIINLYEGKNISDHHKIWNNHYSYDITNNQNKYKYKYIYRNTRKHKLLNIKTFDFFPLEKNHVTIISRREKKKYYSFIKFKTLRRLINKWFLLNNDEHIIHPLKNCLWKITVYNFFLQKKDSFYVHLYEDGRVKTSNNLEGRWYFNNYYLTWVIEYEDRRVFYTAELFWNQEKSKMIKGIIYQETKKNNSFIPSYMFRKILGSFSGKIENQ